MYILDLVAAMQNVETEKTEKSMHFLVSAYETRKCKKRSHRLKRAFSLIAFV